MLTKLPDIIDDKVMAAGEVGTTEQSSVWGRGDGGTQGRGDLQSIAPADGNGVLKSAATVFGVFCSFIILLACYPCQQTDKFDICCTDYEGRRCCYQ